MRKRIFTIWIGVILWSGSGANVWAGGLKDVKPPEDYPFEWGGIALWDMLVLAFVLALLFLFLRNRKKKMPLKKKEVIILPWEKAFQLLEALKQEQLVSQGKTEEYFLRLSTILRYYLEEELALNAPDRTTEEFLMMLKTNAQMNNQQKNTLKEFLNCSDMVKFAKYNPGPDHAEQSMEIVKRLINETKKTVRIEEENKP